MPTLSSACFGQIEFSDSAVFEFPSGLPGFENERAFVFLQRADAHPLIFMHSLSNQELCFVLLPVLAADAHYQLSLTPEEKSELQLPLGVEPQIGEELLCGALVSAADTDRPGPTVNLLAPIVVNLKEKIGIQAIQTHSGYSHRHVLIAQEETASCL